MYTIVKKEFTNVPSCSTGMIRSNEWNLMSGFFSYHSPDNQEISGSQWLDTVVHTFQHTVPTVPSQGFNMFCHHLPNLDSRFEATVQTPTSPSPSPNYAAAGHILGWVGKGWDLLADQSSDVSSPKRSKCKTSSKSGVSNDVLTVSYSCNLSQTFSWPYVVNLLWTNWNVSSA